MEFNANQQVKEVSIEAVIIRADGTREDLGVIAHQTFEPKPGFIQTLKRIIAKWLR